jgi:hypothetical protein
MVKARVAKWPDVELDIPQAEYDDLKAQGLIVPEQPTVGSELPADESAAPAAPRRRA